MEHFYDNIDSENWFDFQEIYKMVVEKFSENSHFVEVGVWKGKSACFMAVEIINSGKNIVFDCVDSWSYLTTQTDISEGAYHNLFEIFLKNITPVKDVINIKKGISWEISNEYNDNSLDFIFIDAGHDYDSVKRDITNWLPKLKKNGIIAGHDYEFPPIKKVVCEIFGEEKINILGSSWLINNYEK